MPIKHYKPTQKELDDWFDIGFMRQCNVGVTDDIYEKVLRLRRVHYCRIPNCKIEGNHVHVERSPFFQTKEYLDAAIEEYNLYYTKVLTHLKPANYS